VFRNGIYFHSLILLQPPPTRSNTGLASVDERARHNVAYNF